MKQAPRKACASPATARLLDKLRSRTERLTRPCARTKSAGTDLNGFQPDNTDCPGLLVSRNRCDARGVSPCTLEHAHSVDRAADIRETGPLGLWFEKNGNSAKTMEKSPAWK